MWKIVAVLLLTAAVILLARLVYKAPVVQTRVGLSGIELAGQGEHAGNPALHVCRHQGVITRACRRPGGTRRLVALASDSPVATLAAG